MTDNSDSVWPRGAVTATGSLPGTDPAEAARLVFGELADLPFLPELPARGVGADMVGRGAALLVSLPVEIVPSGWRLTSHPGRDLGRALDFLRHDLDALEQQADGYQGALKVQAPGPWTLAASLELPSGHRVVSDHGAVRDLSESLAEGLRLHLEDLGRRVPGADLVLQLDEPSLPAVLAGRVPTASGYGTVRAVTEPDVSTTLAGVLAVADPGCRVVHCCAPDVPFGLLRGAGADAVAFDLAVVGATRAAVLDALGETVDAGVSLWLGVVPGTDDVFDRAATLTRIEALWSALGFSRDVLPDRIVATTACGLAGATPNHARRALRLLREVGQDLLQQT